jgi:hypothetical protein
MVPAAVCRIGRGGFSTPATIVEHPGVSRKILATGAIPFRVSIGLDGPADSARELFLEFIERMEMSSSYERCEAGVGGASYAGKKAGQAFQLPL